MKELPWKEMRRCYEREGLSYRQIAQRFGAGYSTVCNRARQEGWRDLRGLVRGLGDTARRALENLQQEECPDIRSIKELTAIMRELTNLDRSLEGKSEDTVQVILAPEVEEWSR